MCVYRRLGRLNTDRCSLRPLILTVTLMVTRYHPSCQSDVNLSESCQEDKDCQVGVSVCDVRRCSCQEQFEQQNCTCVSSLICIKHQATNQYISVSQNTSRKLTLTSSCTSKSLYFSGGYLKHLCSSGCALDTYYGLAMTDDCSQQFDARADGTIRDTNTDYCWLPVIGGADVTIELSTHCTLASAIFDIDPGQRNAFELNKTGDVSLIPDGNDAYRYEFGVRIDKTSQWTGGGGVFILVFPGSNPGLPSSGRLAGWSVKMIWPTSVTVQIWRPTCQSYRLIGQTVLTPGVNMPSNRGGTFDISVNDTIMVRKGDLIGLQGSIITISYGGLTDKTSPEYAAAPDVLHFPTDKVSTDNYLMSKDLKKTLRATMFVFSAIVSVRDNYDYKNYSKPEAPATTLGSTLETTPETTITTTTVLPSTTSTEELTDGISYTSGETFKATSSSTMFNSTSQATKISVTSQTTESTSTLSDRTSTFTQSTHTETESATTDETTKTHPTARVESEESTAGTRKMTSKSTTLPSKLTTPYETTTLPAATDAPEIIDPDDRASAKGIGIIALLLVLIFLGLIVLMDILTILQNIDLRVKKYKARRRWKTIKNKSKLFGRLKALKK